MATPRAPDLRFLIRGSRRGLLFLAGLAVVGAVSEAFLLAAIVQSLAALSSGQDLVDLGAGPLSLSASAQTLLGAAVIAAVVRGGSAAWVALRGPRIVAASRQRHRTRLFESYISADWSTQAADRSGRLLQTFSSSINEANTAIMMITQAMPAALTLTVLVAVALVVDPLTTAFLILVGAFIGLALRPISRRAQAQARSDAARRQLTASHVSGVLAAGAEIAVLGSRDGVISEARKRIAAAESAYSRAAGLKRLVSVTGQSLAFIVAALSLYLLTLADSAVDFATVGTIVVLLIRGAGLAQQVQTAWSQYGTVAPFIEQVRTQIEHYESSTPTFGSADFPPHFDIELHDVEYTYPGSRSTAVGVDHVVIPTGTSVAVVGPSGSGKSTLIQLLLRLRRPTTGSITVGGVPLGDVADAAFSDHVAYVPQAPHLVPGTVADNIRFFRDGLSDVDIMSAARRAHVHDDIMQMPRQYETPLDGHVDMLSGGQKQRLALARALARRPAVLVLDEPTSALDETNERLVLGTLHSLRGRTTVIMITHKTSSLADCDAVLRIDQGRVDRSTLEFGGAPGSSAEHR